MAKVKDIHQYVFEGSNFRHLLEEFSKETNKKNYNRLSYHDWKTLIRFSKDAFITITINCDENFSRIRTSSNEYFVAQLNDKSFGEFLFNYFIKGGSPEMTKNDYLNIAIDATAINGTSDWCDGLTANSASVSSSTTSDWNTITDRTYYNPYLTITDTKADKEDLARVEAKIDNHIRKENEKMKGFNFDFGPMNGSVVRLSMYGLAVKNKTGTYVAYDAANGALMDVDILNFDGTQFLYKMPVAIKDIAAGDIVIHQGVPMFVQNVVNTNKSLVVIDPVNGERKEIMLARSPFKFDFATKIVNLLGNFNCGASADSPFGNMLPLLMLGNDNHNIDPLMYFAMMGNCGNINFSNNPMLMYALMKNDKNSDILPFLMMSNFSNSTPDKIN